MKRKFDEVTHKSKKPQLKIEKPSVMPCVICSNPIYNYEQLSCYVCSDDCFEVFLLSLKNNYLHEKDKNLSFNDDENTTETKK